MQKVRNVKGKVDCRVKEKERIVEIIRKGCRTLIYFKPDGTAEIINTII